MVAYFEGSAGLHLNEKGKVFRLEELVIQLSELEHGEREARLFYADSSLLVVGYEPEEEQQALAFIQRITTALGAQGSVLLIS